MVQRGYAEGQQSGRDEMASTLAQSEQLAFNLYREGVNLQEEHARQMNVAQQQYAILERLAQGPSRWGP